MIQVQVNTRSIDKRYTTSREMTHMFSLPPCRRPYVLERVEVIAPFKLIPRSQLSRAGSGKASWIRIGGRDVINVFSGDVLILHVHGTSKLPNGRAPSDFIQFRVHGEELGAKELEVVMREGWEKLDA